MSRASGWIAVAAFALIGLGGAALAWASSASRVAVPQPEVFVDTTPLRGAFRPLRLRRMSFEYACMECHYMLEPAIGRRPLVAEHTDIVLNHGRNDYCLNCHHPTDRDAYVEHDGSPIPSDSPAELCAKCHGLVHRDWTRGAHGRREGAWDPAAGVRRQLLCIQCHDPHAPAFPALAPLPGPRHARGDVPAAEGGH